MLKVRAQWPAQGSFGPSRRHRSASAYRGRSWARWVVMDDPLRSNPVYGLLPQGKRPIDCEPVRIGCRRISGLWSGNLVPGPSWKCARSAPIATKGLGRPRGLSACCCVGPTVVAMRAISLLATVAMRSRNQAGWGKASRVWKSSPWRLPRCLSRWVVWGLRIVPFAPDVRAHDLGQSGAWMGQPNDL